MHASKKDGRGAKSDSYIEIRLLALILGAFFLLAFVLPAVVRAIDTNGDNLDDAWEAQYGITTNAYAATNLVGWWQLNGTNSSDNATDRSGNGIHGTLSGFPSNAYGTGLFSNALYFTTNSTVFFPTTNAALNATNAFTFSAWVQATNNLSQPTVIATWNDSATNGWSVGSATNGIAQVTFFDGATAQVVSATAHPVNLYDGYWHQIAATYATNHAATVYVDGIASATNSISGWTPGSVSSFTFGANDIYATNNPYALDEVRLYNRALSSSEVVNLPVTYSDLNNSGLTVFEDYIEGLDPIATSGIVTSGFLGSGFTGYYSGLPTLTKSSGDGQTVSASTFASSPLVVQVKNGSGTALAGAPVTFLIASGSAGGLSLTSGGTTGTSVSLTTDSSGYATIYYKSGTEALQNNIVTAMAVSNSGTASVSFTVHCGVQSSLALWFRADTGTTVDVSGNVGTWQDQGPNQFNCSQSTTANKPVLVNGVLNGKPVLQFSGSQSLVGTGSTGITGSSGTTIIAVASTTVPADQRYIVTTGSTTTLLTTRQIGYKSSGQTFSFSGYDAVSGSAPSANYYVEDAVTLSTSGSSVTFYRNGSSTGTATLGAAGGTVTSGFSVGSYIGNTYSWKGNVAELLVYNRVLTLTEYQQIAGALADKYGLYSPYSTWPSAYSSLVQAEITRNQWTKVQADNYVAMQAANPTVMSNGLGLWLKSDAGTTVVSGKVTSWADQTGNYTVSQATSSNQPSYIASDINGKPALRFSGSQALLSSAAMGVGFNADITMIAVGSTTSPNGHQYSAWLGGNTNHTSRGIGYFSSKEVFDTNNYDWLGGNPQLAGTFVSEIATINSSLTSVNFYQNGTLTGTGTVSGVLNLIPGITIGGAGSTTVCPWTGDIAEVMVYDHQLNSTELAQVDLYLADKYGFYDVNATWPLAYSSLVQAEITRNQWTKVQADNYVAFQAANPTMLTNGLGLWFKADAGVTQSSGKVSAWADQAGSYTVSQSTSSNQPSYIANDINGKPALRFNGSQALLSSAWMGAGYNSDMTIITVGMTTAPSTHQYSTWLGANTNHTSRGVGYFGSQEVFDTYNYDCRGAVPPTSGVFTTEIATINSGLNSVHFYQNGTLTATSSISGVQNLAPGISIGTAASLSVCPWYGDIAEVLVYDHQLSSAELDQINSYLADKYGLPVSVAAPTISPNGGTQSSPTTVSIGTAYSPAVIRYTLDGTTPTSGSPQYTSTLTLTDSRPVSAAVFLGNVQISPVATAQFYIGDSGSIGISDAWQTTYFGHTGISLTDLSPGGSGLTNLQAYLYGYDPTVYSTNGDGLSDLVNWTLGYSATNTDINGYGLTNAQQLALGLDPFDTGINPALPTSPTPDPSDHTAPVITLTAPDGATLLP